MQQTLRNHHVFHFKQELQNTFFNYEYFSDSRRLYRAVATFILYVRKLKARNAGISNPEVVSYEMIQQAKTVIFQRVQEDQFFKEIRLLKLGKKIDKNSQLISFNTFLDEKGVLRARGRASYLNHHDAIILPNKHHVTSLLVHHIHVTFHHISHETVINRIKCQYQIPKLRRLYKTVRATIHLCWN